MIAGPDGLVDLAARIAALAHRIAGRRPVAPPAPLERTDRAPWRWATAQARRSGVDPAALGSAVRHLDGVAAVFVRDDGLLHVLLTTAAVEGMLQHLATGGVRVLPEVTGRPEPAPGLDVVRFEAARTAEGGSPSPAPLLARRVLGNPVVAVQLAHSRASRAESLAEPGPGVGSDLRDWGASADALVTEVFDAPRLFRSYAARPRQVTVALGGVAAAYLAWEVAHPPGRPCPGVTLLPGAARVVLERGLALLGVHAPARM